MKHIFTISISLFFFVAAFSQAGTLDKSFNGTGKKIIGFSYGGVAGEDDCHAMAIQSDGKSVLAGWSNATQGGDYNFVVTRLNTDGTLDQSFNGKGYIFINFSGDDKAAAVAIQADGKIVVAGTADYSSITPKISVARLSSGGLLDPTFGSNFSGKVITDFGDNEPYAHCMAIQGDGKIVVGGSFYIYGTTTECLLLRYNTNGTLDQSFGVLGKSFTDFGSGQSAHSLAIQTDGKIVVGADGYGQPLIARFKSNGSLDGGFGNNGKRIISLVTCSAIAIQGDGKIVVTGSYQGSQSSDFALVRYNINGTIDTTFSGDGKAITNFGGSTSSDDWPYGVAIQGDGKIVVAGYTYRSGSGDDFALVRYNKNGTLDNTFGDHGKVITDFGNSQNGNDEKAYAVKIQSNSKIVAAGTRNENFPGNFAVARYHGDNAAPEIFAGESNTEEMIAEEKSSSIRIFPNPVTTMLRVEGLDPTSAAIISISNLSGTVFQKATVSGREYEFDLSVLKPGIYNLTIARNNVTTCLKFIKQ